jgi:hypothetical protein
MAKTVCQAVDHTNIVVECIYMNNNPEWIEKTNASGPQRACEVVVSPKTTISSLIYTVDSIKS